MARTRYAESERYCTSAQFGLSCKKDGGLSKVSITKRESDPEMVYAIPRYETSLERLAGIVSVRIILFIV